MSYPKIWTNRKNQNRKPNGFSHFCSGYVSCPFISGTYLQEGDYCPSRSTFGTSITTSLHSSEIRPESSLTTPHSSRSLSTPSQASFIFHWLLGWRIWLWSLSKRWRPQNQVPVKEHKSDLTVKGFRKLFRSQMRMNQRSVGMPAWLFGCGQDAHAPIWVPSLKR